MTTSAPASAIDAPARPVPAPERPRVGRFLVGWSLAWAAVGLAVGGAVAWFGEIAPNPAVPLSVGFALVVGLSSYISARAIFPRFVRLPWAVNLPLQVATLLSAAVFGSVLVILFSPLFFLAQPRVVAAILAVNAVLAVIVGIALSTYDSMRRQIERSYRTEREKEALERDLKIARDVQQQLLPRGAPSFEGLELAGICIPAVGIGGDYFDFLPRDDRRIGLVIADVSGKGIPAALLMAGLQASLRSLGLSTDDPAKLNAGLNNMMFAQSSSSRYATLFQAVYDARTRRLVYSNAGHHPALVLRGSERIELGGGGFPIGMFEDARYERSECDLRPGDLIALYTDGVVELTNRRGEEFGVERLARALSDGADAGPQELLDRALAALGSWSDGGEGRDDITLVLGRAR